MPSTLPPPAILAAVFAAAASCIAWSNLKRAEAERRWLLIQHTLMLCAALACAILLAGHWNARSLYTHLDAFLLVNGFLAAALLFLQTRPKLYGVSAFGSPLLALMLVWAMCPTVVGTPFQGRQGASGAWLSLHLLTVLAGLLSAVTGAVCGGMYLYVQKQLKDKKQLGKTLNLMSLETLEGAMIRACTLSVALVSMGLATGVVLQIHRGAGTAWLASPKVLLAGAAWLVYALLMNVRHASAFRGRRAAWLSIVGLALVMAVYGIALATASAAPTKEPAEPQPPAMFPTGGRP